MNSIAEFLGFITKEWTIEGSTIFRNVGLAVTAFLGLLILFWRAIAADRASKAALLQARNSTEQIKISNETLAFSLKQNEFMIEQAKMSEKRNDSEVFLNSISMIEEGRTETAIIGAIYSLSKLCDSDKHLTYKVVKILSIHINEKTRIDYEVNFYPKASDELDPKEKAQSLRDLPYWTLGLKEQCFREMPDQDLTEDERERLEKIRQTFITVLFDQRLRVKEGIPYWQTGGGERAAIRKKQSAQEAFDEICRLMDLYDPSHIMPVFFENCDLSGLSFSARNCENFYFSNCLIRLSGMNSVLARNAYFQNADFRGTLFNDAKFDGSIFNICDFSGSNIRGASFKSCKFRLCNLLGVDGLSADQFEGSTFEGSTSGLPEQLKGLIVDDG